MSLAKRATKAHEANMDVVERIIRRLGGTRRLSTLAGISPSTIQSWKAAGVIPSRRIPEIIAAAARLDPPVYLRPDDFFDLPAVAGSTPPLGTPAPAQPAP